MRIHDRLWGLSPLLLYERGDLMEYVDAITQSIRDLGFPITMCLLMFYLNHKSIAALTNAVNELKVIVQGLIDKTE